MSSAAQAIKAAGAIAALSDCSSTNALEFLPCSQSSLDLRGQIEAFVDTQGSSHPFQLPHWSGEDNGFYATVYKNRDIQLFSRCDLVWPLGKWFDRLRALTLTRGPVCDDPEVMHATLSQLVELCRDHGFVYLDLNPDWSDRKADQLGSWLRSHAWFPVGPVRASLRIDLRPALPDILNSFRKTTRSEIRRAQSAGAHIVPAADGNASEEFLELYQTMAREKGFAPEPEQHVRNVLAWLFNNSRRGVLLSASWKGELLGGVVAIRAGSRCWYVWGATKKSAPVTVGHLLQWQAVKWAKEQGCNEYDLGGYREGAHDGPALFKRGFSERIVRFLPTYRYAIDPAKYSLLRLLTPGLSAAKAALHRFHPARRDS
jgi:Acetyltransferase (GNAT) domain